MSAKPYSWLDLFPGPYSVLPSDTAIRLIHLLPGSVDSEIHIKLIVSELESAALYEALSYEWGIPAVLLTDDDGSRQLTMLLKAQIQCDAVPIFITENLREILRQLRWQEATRVLWIDAICINQDDLDERSKQILLMRPIYERASKVLCWIGEGKDETAMAFVLIRRIARDYTASKKLWASSSSKRTVETFAWLRETWTTCGGKYWPAINDIYTRSYFGRVWVVQEIVVSTNADVVSGPFRVPWSDLITTLGVILTLGLVKDKPAHNWSTDVSQEIFRHIGHLGRRRRGRTTSSLRELAELFLGHDVSDPRDRIFGMLGIIVAQSKYGLHNQIQPDYTKPVHAVFQDACEWSMRDSQSLAILDLCDAPATNKLLGLPTWVPDLTKGPQRCPIEKKNPDKQTGTPALLSLFGKQFQVSVKGKVLVTKGLIFDTIVDAGLPCTTKTKHLVLMAAFREFCLDNQAYPTGGTKLEAMWRTLLRNYLRSSSSTDEDEAPPVAFGVHFAKAMAGEWLSHLGLPDAPLPTQSDIASLRDRFSNFHLKEMYPEDFENNVSILALMAKHPFIQLLFDSMKMGDDEKWSQEIRKRSYLGFGDEGRQFVTTEKGYMGLGQVTPPLGTEGSSLVLPDDSYAVKGDAVAVLAGSEHAWILRRQEDDNFRLLGYGYFYGLTGGECFDRERPPVLRDLEIE